MKEKIIFGLMKCGDMYKKKSSVAIAKQIDIRLSNTFL